MAPLSKNVIAWVAAGIVVVTVSVVVLLWWGGTSGLNGEKLVTARFDALRTGLSIGLAGGGVFALYLAWRRQHSTEIGLLQKQQDQSDVARAYTLQERTALASEADAAARRITELYTKAVEQLGSDKAPVRLGGLYALERLAQDNKSQRQTIVNVLCAYLRMPYQLPGDPPGDEAQQEGGEEYREWVQEREVRLAAQRLLATHLRPGDLQNPVVTFWLDIDLDLTGAILINLDLRGCHLREATFQSAQFAGETLFTESRFAGDAWFTEVRFAGAAGFGKAEFASDTSFREARFADTASFHKADFAHAASFDQAEFAGRVSFTQSRFADGASFVQAEFAGRNPWFDRAEFAGRALFTQSEFADGASFVQTKFARDAEFGQSRFAGGTQFDQAKFGGTASFDQATLAGGVWFRKAVFGDAASFNQARFVDAASFDQAEFGGAASFVQTTFPGGTRWIERSFTGVVPEQLARLLSPGDNEESDGDEGRADEQPAPGADPTKQ